MQLAQTASSSLMHEMNSSTAGTLIDGRAAERLQWRQEGLSGCRDFPIFVPISAAGRWLLLMPWLGSTEGGPAGMPVVCIGRIAERCAADQIDSLAGRHWSLCAGHGI